MKFKELFEADTWAKELAAANRAKAKREAELKKLDAKIKADATRVAKKPKIDPQEIFKRVETAIGNSFPDGDPIDHLIPWMKQNDISMAQIDAAVKKFAKPAKGMYHYLSGMWEDATSDAMSDAKRGHVDDNSPFYGIEDGKPVAKPNPWKEYHDFYRSQ